MFAAPVQRGLLALLSVISAGGCERGTQGPSTTMDAEQNKMPATERSFVAGAHERAHAVFQNAAYLKPAHQEAGQSRADVYAPLVAIELAGQATTLPSNLRFGAVELSGKNGSQSTVDPERPTIYVIESVALIGDRSLEQITYAWLYPSREASTPTWRAVRLTLDESGFAVATEVLGSGLSQRPIFVSNSLEQRAARQHGPPLPGRRYSIEPDMQALPTVVVPRVLDDGPQPMGPWVYIGADGEVSGVLCRCMPSQVEAFAETKTYSLDRVHETPAIHDQGPSAARTRRAVAVLLSELNDGADRLGRALRWPGTSDE
jgi:hypothetical protein